VNPPVDARIGAAAVLDLFRASRALLEGHFQLSSGRHSNQYFQCALLLAHPVHAETMARAVAAKLTVKPELVMGPALGAVVWAQEVARVLGTRAFFSERVDSAMALRRGFELRPKEKILVVEDVLTTGGSVREVLKLIRELGGETIGVAALVNRSGRDNPFEAEGLPFTALADVEAVSWDPAECPLCRSGAHGPAVKPGRRPGASSKAKT
jgi:orotate phosphoribosyltransferase